jgi:hypothetical protein
LNGLHLGSEKNNGDVTGGACCPELGQHGRAIHRRHHHVEQDGVRLMLLSAFNRLRTTVCLDHIPPGHRAQAAGCGVTCFIIVIHNQNAPFHSHSPGTWGLHKVTQLSTIRASTFRQLLPGGHQETETKRKSDPARQVLGHFQSGSNESSAHTGASKVGLFLRKSPVGIIFAGYTYRGTGIGVRDFFLLLAGAV